LNLVVNGIDAMKDISSEQRSVSIRTSYAYDEDRLIDACARARRVLWWRCV